MKTRSINRSHTKSGPGRYHGQCQLITNPANGDVLGVRKPAPKRSTAANGGNHAGKPYLSYAEHDRCVRATFGAPHGLARAARYDVERRHIVATR